MSIQLRALFDRLNTQAMLCTKEGLRVDVRLIDHKSAYGNDLWLVEPVEGEGRAWVNESRLIFPDVQVV